MNDSAANDLDHKKKKKKARLHRTTDHERFFKMLLYLFKDPIDPDTLITGETSTIICR